MSVSAAHEQAGGASTGERLVDVGGGITLCYEAFGSPQDPPLLLVMGLGTQMIGWHDDFCARLAGRGFHVVRFDNRDAGRSTHVEGPPPTLLQLATRRFFPPGQYRLGDMARDTAGLLRELDLAPAHVVGASMGGMIAQTLAIEHPELVRSLCSIMSNPGGRLNGQPALGTYRFLLRRGPNDHDAYVDFATRLFAWIGSRGLPQDRDDIRGQIERSLARGHDPNGGGRQLAAILASPDRTRDLASVRVPTLVIHGTTDRMIAPSGGRATARAIPGAELLSIEGMGHDLPRAAWDRIIDAIVRNAARADASAS